MAELFLLTGRWPKRVVQTLLVGACASSLLAQNAQAIVPSAQQRRADSVLIDSFDTLNQWRTNPANGVEVSIHSDAGLHGAAMRVDFDFHGRQGYWIVHRDLPLELPPNYRFTFALRADAPANNLEFKLVGRDGSSVWWSRKMNFDFPRDWQTLARSKREICYAWGQQSNRNDARQISAIEFAVSTGTGGKGSVWIDDLALAPLDLESPFGFTAPVASSPLVGTWESVIDERGGSGAKLDFAADGTFRSIVGLMGPFKYQVDKDRLTIAFGDSTVARRYTFTTGFRIANDTYFQNGENLLGRDITMKRIGTADPRSPIRGVWAMNDYAGATGFVLFDEAGKGELRIPTQSCSGTWKVGDANRLVTEMNGENTESSYAIKDDTLVVRQQHGEGKYVRRTRSP